SEAGRWKGRKGGDCSRSCKQKRDRATLRRPKAPSAMASAAPCFFARGTASAIWSLRRLVVFTSDPTFALGGQPNLAMNREPAAPWPPVPLDGRRRNQTCT